MGYQIRQVLEFTAGNKDNSRSLYSKDFEINPPKTELLDSTVNESAYFRFRLDPDQQLSVDLGSISLAKLLVIRQTASGVKFAIENEDGGSPFFALSNTVWSVMHMQFTGLTLKNTATTAAEVTLFIAGD
jgi:hypothetical protein